MSTSPNVAGFREAQSRLRNLLGSDASFVVKGPVVYPPGTKIDNETGRPHDPTIRPTSEPETLKTHKVGVLILSARNTENPEATWGGLRQGDRITIDMDPEVAADVEGATEVIIKELRFAIEEMHIDPGLDNRWLAVIELK